MENKLEDKLPFNGQTASVVKFQHLMITVIYLAMIVGLVSTIITTITLMLVYKTQDQLLEGAIIGLLTGLGGVVIWLVKNAPKALHKASDSMLKLSNTRLEVELKKEEIELKRSQIELEAEKTKLEIARTKKKKEGI